jgi:PTS system cellobiose-specific IIC component
VPGLRAFLDRRVVPALTALSEHTALSAIRTGMVSVVPLTVIGGLFMVIAYLPVPPWQRLVEPHLPLLQVPVTATFGLLGLIACITIAYDFGTRLRQEPIVSATMAAVVFMLIQVEPADLTFRTAGLGSQGLFPAILVALVVVWTQALLTRRGIVITMPDTVPAVVAQSFLSIVPLLLLVVAFWAVRFIGGVDINHVVQQAFAPLVFALNTLPGILVYACLVSLLWAVGIHGDNTLDAIVAPIFLQYLAENVTAMSAGQPLPYVTANGFFTTFVNVGGTGATLALALILAGSKDAGFRQVGRLSLPTQVFQINEPIFFGLPIVLNPIFMVPYVLSALALTAGSYLVMSWGLVQRPFVNVPWTTPPIIGHYLVTGGDWRAAVWGVASLAIALAIYYPFTKAAERARRAGGDV